MRRAAAAIFLACAELGATALGDLAAGMQPGEWRELSTENFNREMVYLDAKDQDGSTANTDWANWLVWDAKTEQIFYLGAGHLRVHKFMRYQAAENRWFGDSNLPDCMQLPVYEGCFTHGYDNGTIDEARSVFYYTSGRRLFAFDIATETWSDKTMPQAIPAGYGHATEYFPPLNAIVQIHDGTVGLYETATGKGMELASGLAMGPYHQTAEFEPKSRKLYFGGGNGSRAFYALDSALNIGRLKDAPEDLLSSSTVLTRDPVLGEILFLSQSAQHYAYRPEDDAWRKIAHPPFTYKGDAGSHALASPIANHGVVMYLVPQGLYKVYLYRHAAGAASLARPPGANANPAGTAKTIRRYDAAGRRIPEDLAAQKAPAMPAFAFAREKP